MGHGKCTSGAVSEKETMKQLNMCVLYDSFVRSIRFQTFQSMGGATKAHLHGRFVFFYLLSIYLSIHLTLYITLSLCVWMFVATEGSNAFREYLHLDFRVLKPRNLVKIGLFAVAVPFAIYQLTKAEQV